MATTVLIADDHPLFRQALALAVQRVVPDVHLLEAGTLAAASRAVGEADGLRLILLDRRQVRRQSGYVALGDRQRDRRRAAVHQVPARIPDRAVARGDGSR